MTFHVNDATRQIRFAIYLGEKAGGRDTLSVKKYFPLPRPGQSDAEWKKFVAHIEQIVDAHRNDVPHLRSTIQWVDNLPKRLKANVHKKLLASDPAFRTQDTDLASLVDLYEAERANGNASYTTDQAVMRSVRYLLNKCPSDVTRISSDLMLDIHAELYEDFDYSKNTANKYAGHWSQFFSYLLRERVISINPCDELPKDISTRPKESIKSEWLDEIVRSATTSEERYWIRLLQWTGCRVGEALRLRVCDFDLQAGKITFDETKNNRIRINPLYRQIEEHLRPLLKGREPDELVLRKITKDNCRSWLARMQDKLGLPRWSPPYMAFRATRANQLASDKVISSTDAGMLLGHSAVVARKNYLSVDDSLLEKLRGAG